MLDKEFSEELAILGISILQEVTFLSKNEEINHNIVQCLEHFVDQILNDVNLNRFVNYATRILRILSNIVLWKNLTIFEGKK